MTEGEGCGDVVRLRTGLLILKVCLEGAYRLREVSHLIVTNNELFALLFQFLLYPVPQDT